ncbi:MAG: DEAD/DEAH box helicase family protein [Anaerolineales bacterium]
MPTPEQLARQDIDRLLEASGWVVQDRAQLNPSASLGVAVREFSVNAGAADYLLIVAGKAAGVVEAKPAGTTLSGVAEQSAKYTTGLPDFMQTWGDPLPFAYESNGVETLFRDVRDPNARSRRVYTFHRPEQLQEWAQQPDTLRARLRQLPELPTACLRACQVEAVTGLERSFAQGHPRALIQMATGSGKTYAAITAVYRLIKFGHASIGGC